MHKGKILEGIGYNVKILKNEIEDHLREVKAQVKINNYQIERNSNRRVNNELFLNYILSEEEAKKILLSLEVNDFCHIKVNKHARFKNELLYVFGKDIPLIERFKTGEKVVTLYIKINKLEDKYVIVVSFHESAYPMKYYFKMNERKGR